MLVKNHKTPVFASCGTGAGMCAGMPDAGPYISCFEIGMEFDMGEISVQSFKTPHDADGSTGYSLRAGGRKLVFVTDLGSLTDEVVTASLGADMAVIEANHDLEMLKTGPYPRFLKQRILSARGHLANRDSAWFAVLLADSGTKNILLAHLSQENNTPLLAQDTVGSMLRENGFAPGKDITLDVASPFTPGDVYKL